MLVTLVAFLFIGSLHIPLSCAVYFIPIKSIEILNVTNCDHFLETNIVSSLTVTTPKTRQDGYRTQIVAIAFKSDQDLDDKAVISISDMKPHRSTNTNSTSKWIRNKTYINRHNLCGVLNNYLATGISGNVKPNQKSKNVQEFRNDLDNNVELDRDNSDFIAKKLNKVKICPIASGQYVLPRFKWKSPSMSVPALFLGYQKYVIEVLKPSTDGTSEEMLMCKIVTIFLHPIKNY